MDVTHNRLDTKSCSPWNSVTLLALTLFLYFTPSELISWFTLGPRCKRIWIIHIIAMRILSEWGAVFRFRDSGVRGHRYSACCTTGNSQPLCSTTTFGSYYHKPSFIIQAMFVWLSILKKPWYPLKNIRHCVPITGFLCIIRPLREKQMLTCVCHLMQLKV